MQAIVLLLAAVYVAALVVTYRYSRMAFWAQLALAAGLLYWIAQAPQGPMAQVVLERPPSGIQQARAGAPADPPTAPVARRASAAADLPAAR